MYSVHFELIKKAVIEFGPKIRLCHPDDLSSNFQYLDSWNELYFYFNTPDNSTHAVKIELDKESKPCS